MTDQVDEIKQKVDIVDLVSEYLPLKKAGRNLSGLCPFHQEKTASFMVSPDRQIWRCFGCGKGGDIFTFIQEREGLEFPEALEVLADRAGVTLQKTKTGQKSEKDKLHDISKLAGQFFEYMLWKHKIGAKARQYLQSRGILTKTAEEYGVGYAPDSFELLLKFLKNKNFDESTIALSGLVVAGQKGGFYDRFRDRLIFPIKDVSGRVVGFSGRVIPNLNQTKDNQGAKYINSPETPIFFKGNLFFGLDVAKDEITAKNEAILVEGEFDVLASHQAQVKNVVAVKGTSLTERQINLIKRFTETISLCFDTDLAGDAAARRSVEMADTAGLNTKIIQLGKSKDPADLVSEDPKKWQEATKKAIGVYDFLIDSALRRFDATTAVGKRKIGQELLPILAKINDDLVKAHYIKQLSLRIDLSEDVLRSAISKRRPLEVAENKKDELSRPGITGLSRHERLEELLLALLLQKGELVIELKTLPEQGDFLSDTLKNIFKAYIIAASANESGLALNRFIKKLAKEEQEIADRLALVNLGDIVLDQNLFERVVSKTASEISKLALKEKIKKISKELSEAEKEKKEEKINTLRKRFSHLSVRLTSLKES